jgi:hypothetical protein
VFKIKTSLLLSTCALLTLSTISAHAAGEVWEVRYYAGKLAIYDTNTKATYYEDATLYQINDPYRGTITQQACVKDINAGTKPYVVKSNMIVDGNNKISNVSDRTDFGQNSKLTGTGVAKSSPWNWNNRYRLSLNYAGSAKAIDYKHIEADVQLSPDRMSIRREVYGPNGKLKQKWHGTLRQVSNEQFKNDTTSKNCWKYMD